MVCFCCLLLGENIFLSFPITDLFFFGGEEEHVVATGLAPDKLLLSALFFLSFSRCIRRRTSPWRRTFFSAAVSLSCFLRSPEDERELLEEVLEEVDEEVLVTESTRVRVGGGGGVRDLVVVVFVFVVGGLGG